MNMHEFFKYFFCAIVRFVLLRTAAENRYWDSIHSSSLPLNVESVIFGRLISESEIFLEDDSLSFELLFLAENASNIFCLMDKLMPSKFSITRAF